MASPANSALLIARLERGDVGNKGVCEKLHHASPLSAPEVVGGTCAFFRTFGCAKHAPWYDSVIAQRFAKTQQRDLARGAGKDNSASYAALRNDNPMTTQSVDDFGEIRSGNLARMGNVLHKDRLSTHGLNVPQRCRGISGGLAQHCGDSITREVYQYITFRGCSRVNNRDFYSLRLNSSFLVLQKPGSSCIGDILIILSAGNSLPRLSTTRILKPLMPVKELIR